MTQDSDEGWNSKSDGKTVAPQATHKEAEKENLFEGSIDQRHKRDDRKTQMRLHEHLRNWLRPQPGCEWQLPGDACECGGDLQRDAYQAPLECWQRDQRR
jgi:hypothetical protein